MLITEHISLHSPLSAVQQGFQSGKSTELAVLNTINDWLVYMEKRLMLVQYFLTLLRLSTVCGVETLELSVFET